MTEKVALSTVNGDPIYVKKYKDVYFPDLELLDPEWGINHSMNFKYRRGDTLLCSYPKCGTHWIGNMMLKLKTFDESMRTPDTVIEFDLQNVLDDQEEPRGMATHQPPKYLPKEHIENNGKIVLMLRNPKDVLVSFYYHTKNAILFNNKQSFDEFFESFTNGIMTMGSIYSYLAQWEQFIYNKGNVEVFYYEDFKRDPKGNLARLIKFIGFNRDEEYMDRVLKETTFTALKAHDETRDATHVTVQDENGKSVIYRKGEVGDWKNHMTTEQSDKMDRLLKESLKHGIIKFE